MFGVSRWADLKCESYPPSTGESFAQLHYEYVSCHGQAKGPIRPYSGNLGHCGLFILDCRQLFCGAVLAPHAFAIKLKAYSYFEVHGVYSPILTATLILNSRVEQALQTRGVAMEMANLLDYNIHAKQIQRMMAFRPMPSQASMSLLLLNRWSLQTRGF